MIESSAIREIVSDSIKAETLIALLKRNGVMVYEDEKYLGAGKRRYYLARAMLARKGGNEDLAKSYELLAETLPWSTDEVA